MPDELTYAGRGENELAALLDLPRVVVRERASSTLDVAHELAAAGAPAGTLVLADEQSAGRGRGGKRWTSRRGGIWLTLLERPASPDALELLSLRIGIRAAPVLERHASGRVLLKWPNDLHTSSGKLGGILIEARWREERPEWVAIGIGINVSVPDEERGAAALHPNVDRVLVLAELVPVIRAAATARGELSAAELERFASRDLARGKRCSEPVAGTVAGIDARGRLLVQTERAMLAISAGSLVLDSTSASAQPGGAKLAEPRQVGLTDVP